MVYGDRLVTVRFVSGIILVYIHICVQLVHSCISLIVAAVWLSGNALALIHRAWLVLGWVTVRGYTISVFKQATQAYSGWSSLRGEAYIEYWRRFLPPLAVLGKKLRVLRNSRPC